MEEINCILKEWNNKLNYLGIISLKKNLLILKIKLINIFFKQSIFLIYIILKEFATKSIPKLKTKENLILCFKMMDYEKKGYLTSK